MLSLQHGDEEDDDNDEGIIQFRHLFSSLHFVPWHHFDLLEEVFKSILNVRQHLQGAVNQTNHVI